MSSPPPLADLAAAFGLESVQAESLSPWSPVLVDPDNAGCEPRLFDLAMAAALLHHDSPAAPRQAAHAPRAGRVLRGLRHPCASDSA